MTILYRNFIPFSIYLSIYLFDFLFLFFSLVNVINKGIFCFCHRDQFMLMLESMRMPTYKASVNTDIAKERERNSKLQSRAAQLEKQIKVLIDDSVALLKARMTELGINATSPGDLLAKAKEIVLRHKQLQAKASKLQAQVASMETEQNRLVALRHQELQEKYNGHANANGITNPHQPLTEDYLLKEISATLSQRKRLHSQVCISLLNSIY